MKILVETLTSQQHILMLDNFTVKSKLVPELTSLVAYSRSDWSGCRKCHLSQLEAEANAEVP